MQYCCRCSVFYASAIGTNGDPIKLPLVLREKETESVEPTTIFDYKNCFLPALNRYVLDGGPAPDPRVHLLIGSAKKLSEIGESVPIYATVASSRALHDLRKVSSAMVCLFFVCCVPYFHSLLNVFSVLTVYVDTCCKCQLSANQPTSLSLSLCLQCKPRNYQVIYRSGLVVSTSDCGVRGPRFESHRRRLCLSRQPLRYTALGTGCAPLLQCLGRLSLLPSVGW